MNQKQQSSLPNRENSALLSILEDERNAREALKISEERMKLALEASNAGVWEWDIINNSVKWSDENYRILGYEPNSFVPTFEHWQQRLHPDDTERAVAQIKKAVETKSDLDIEFRIILPDGTQRWINDRGRFTIDKNQNQVKIFGVQFDITQRKLAEELIQHQKEQYDSLVQNIPVGVFKFRMKQNGAWFFDYVSPRLCQLCNISETEAYSNFMHVFEKIHPDELENFINLNKAAFLNPQTFKWEGKAVVLNEIKWMQIQSNPTILANGDVLWDGVVVDITEQKLLDEKLIESEIHFRQLFENNPQPMWIYDMETLQFLSVNETALKKYGYAKEEFLTMTLKDIRPQKDLAPLLKNIESVTDEFQESGVWRHQLKDGTLIFVEIYSHDLSFENKPSRLVLVNDVTKRKQAEEEIFTINKELKTLNEIITASVSSTNLNEILDIVLTQALQIVGLEGGTICLVEPDDTLKLISHVETSEATLKDFEENNIKVGDCLCGNCAHDNCPLILYNRSEVLKYASREVLQNEEINFHAAFPFTTKEKCVGVLCVFTRTDLKPEPRSLKLLEIITSQVAMAIENVLLVQDLENRIEDRTQQLIEVNKELETFTYSVSHDLKAPLRGIDGYSNLLQELYAKDLNEEAKTFIENIRNGTLQMNQIIEDLLAYSRLDHSLIKKSSARIDLFINHTIDLYQKELNDFQIEVKINIPNILIVADLDGLSIAFRNIFENAIKFTKLVENPKIIVDFKEDKNFCHILVHDNGIGFDMKYYDKVFQIFQRLHRVEDYPGTGIGLAMVQKAMQRMGGKVWATSELGKGSIFYLEIPKNS